MEVKKDKIGHVQESCNDNDGRRIVINGIFIPGAMAPMHYHTEFEESFEILDGELSVWNDGKKHTLKKGDRATVKRNIRHKFKNESQQDVKLLVTIEPGYAPFEQNFRIMMGLQKDGLVEQLSKMTPKMIPVGIVLTGLSDTNLVGFTGFMFRTIKLFFNKSKTDQKRAELIERYC